MISKIAKQESYSISDSALLQEQIMFNPSLFIGEPTLEHDEVIDNSDNSRVEEENGFVPLANKDDLKISMIMKHVHFYMNHELHDEHEGTF